MARKKSRCKITVKGDHELITQIEKMGGDIEKALVEGIELSGKHATTRYKKFIEKHYYTGITEESIVANPKAKIDGSKITMQTGFDIEKGGYPAIALDKGTPKQKPLYFIRSIRKDKVVTGAIGYVLGEAWRKLIK